MLVISLAAIYTLTNFILVTVSQRNKMLIGVLAFFFGSVILSLARCDPGYIATQEDFKSVLQQASSFSGDSILPPSHRPQPRPTTDILIQQFDKDSKSNQLIKEAILDNDSLKNLDPSQVRQLVDSMFPHKCPKGSYLTREGEAGDYLYVSAEGEFEVIKKGKVVDHIGPGEVFGELAILYNTTRTASIRAVRDSNVWKVGQRVFQSITKRTGLQRLQDNVNFLRSVPLLHNVSFYILGKISDALEVEFYPPGYHIVRQGTSGDAFFIISQGSVKVTQRVHGVELDLRILYKGDYFGEQALLKEELRTASVIALAPGVECLKLFGESFFKLIGDLSELNEKEYSDLSRTERPPSSNSLPSEIDQGESGILP